MSPAPRGASYREMADHMLDLYLSSTNQRLNQSMRLLTIVATVFMPLIFLVGVYGTTQPPPAAATR